VLGNFQAPLAGENRAPNSPPSGQPRDHEGTAPTTLIMMESDIMGIVDEPVAKKKAA